MSTESILGMDIDLSWEKSNPKNWRDIPDSDENENDDDDQPWPEEMESILGVSPETIFEDGE